MQEEDNDFYRRFCPRSARPAHQRKKFSQKIDISRLEVIPLTMSVRLQITSGRYRTKYGQAIRTEFIEEFVLLDWTCSTVRFPQ